METSSFFKDAFDYNYHCNNQLIELFENQKKLVSEKSTQLLNHLINAQEIWNSRILEQEISVGVWEIRPLENLKKTNHLNYLRTISILETIALDRDY